MSNFVIPSGEGMAEWDVILAATGAVSSNVHGDSDLQPVAVANDYWGWIADSRVVAIDESGHFPHYTHARELEPIIRDFLLGPSLSRCGPGDGGRREADA